MLFASNLSNFFLYFYFNIGGYTRDEGRVQLNVSKLEYPDVGSEVKVFVTHVDEVENIYAHFLPFNSITLKQSNLKELTLKMNASESVCKFKKIKHIPGNFIQNLVFKQ